MCNRNHIYGLSGVLIEYVNKDLLLYTCTYMIVYYARFQLPILSRLGILLTMVYIGIKTIISA